VGVPPGRAVVRHYRRGGLVARLLGDRFLYTGARRTRPMREFAVLAHAHAAGLPVPRPVAARYVRRGLYYRADLATAAIEPARTLATLVAHGELDGFDWAALGRTIRAFHDAGVWHADLNAHNVLRDADGALWLLDFDRGWVASPRARWRRANLARLERSLLKVGLARAVADVRRDAFAPLRAGYAEPAP
ncbi:MAG TPA: 3-deoxy-D-manno-octulosonic acid kinase, partial [Xanthomonadales bacterium]|nr:3-deoxy-D-manno-octulosonic acid kinase [Xanthomonadales bacterium]